MSLSSSTSFSIPKQGPGTYSSFNFLSILLNRDSRVHNFACSLFFFLLIIIRSGRLGEIRWSVCKLKSLRSLYVILPDWCWVCALHYQLFVWSNVNFLHNFQLITLPTQSCLVLYSFCANLLYSLKMCLMVSSLSPHYY